MSNLNWVDYVILAIFFFSILAGLRRGLVREVIALVTLIAAFVVAMTFTNSLATAFTNSASVQHAVNQTSSTIGMNASQSASYVSLGISFALLFIGTVIVGALLGYFLNMIFQAGILGIGNRILGGAFGFCRGILINLVIIFVVQLSPFAQETWWQQSRYVAIFQPAVQWLGNIVSPSLANLKEKVGQTLQNVAAPVQDMGGAIGGT